MKIKLATILLFSVAFLCTSCLDTLFVVKPKANQTSSQEFSVADDHISITMEFSRAVKKETVVIGKTFLVKTEKDVNADGTLSWSADGKKVTFHSTKTLSDLFDFNPDGGFCIQLIGSDTGQGAIKDLNGHFLDGDSNNKDGGDFNTCFVLVG